MQKGVGLGGRTWKMGRWRSLHEQQKIWKEFLSQVSRPTNLRDRECGGGSHGCRGGGEVHARLDPNMKEQLKEKSREEQLEEKSRSCKTEGVCLRMMAVEEYKSG